MVLGGGRLREAERSRGALPAALRKESSVVLQRNRQALCQALGHRARRAAQARLKLAHGIDHAAHALRERILGEIVAAPALSQPLAEKHGADTAARLGLVVHYFVPLSVYETMTTARRECDVLFPPRATTDRMLRNRVRAGLYLRRYDMTTTSTTTTNRKRSQAPFTAAGNMSNEVNKVIVRRWYDEFWNAGKLEVADELLHPDYVYQEGYGAGAPSVTANKEGHAMWGIGSSLTCTSRLRTS